MSRQRCKWVNWGAVKENGGGGDVHPGEYMLNYREFQLIVVMVILIKGPRIAITLICKRSLKSSWLCEISTLRSISSFTPTHTVWQLFAHLVKWINRPCIWNLYSNRYFTYISTCRIDDYYTQIKSDHLFLWILQTFF